MDVNIIESGEYKANEHVCNPNIKPIVHRCQRGSARKLRAAFKSPMRQEASESSKHDDNTKTSIDELTATHKDIVALEVQLCSLCEEIDALTSEGHNEDEVDKHIERLHDYNEIKDVAQMLLGYIAVKEGLTTKDMYTRFGLNLED